MKQRITTDLNLHGGVPTRIQPSLGVWGPAEVPTTRRKRTWRWLIYVILALVVTATVLYWWYFFSIVKKQIGG